MIPKTEDAGAGAGANALNQTPSETADVYGAYPRLSPGHMELLARYGERRATSSGDLLFREGDRPRDFIAIQSGSVAVVEDYGGPDEHLLGVHGPGRFLGEVGLLTGQAVFATAAVRDPGEVVAVPVDRLGDAVAQDAALGDLILRAYLIRRSALLGVGTGLRIIGSRFATDSRRLREFAARNRLPYTWTDLEHDAQAEAMLRRLGVSETETPVVVWGEKALRNPSNAELAAMVGLRTPSLSDITCDLVVVGSGPSGLAAAVYGASEGLSTVVVDSVAAGGQAGTSSRIENYLGFPAGISGAELADRAVIQAERFGARLTIPAQATALERQDGHHVVRLEDGTSISARTVLIATGARYRRLDVDRLEEFEPTSVYYAATEAEARICVGDPVVIVGGGNSAGQAATFLASRAARISLVVRDADLRARMSRYLADRLERSRSVEILLHCEVRGLIGARTLEAVEVEDIGTGQRSSLATRFLFVFIGADPAGDWLAGQLARDDHGFILTGDHAFATDGGRMTPDTARISLGLETSRQGVFAVGDVRSGSIKRVAAAAGEGATAVSMIHTHLSEVWGSTRS